MRQNKDFDGLVTYLMEEGDGDRLVQNPQRKKLARERKQVATELQALQAEYGSINEPWYHCIRCDRKYSKESLAEAKGVREEARAIASDTRSMLEKIRESEPNNEG